MKKSLLFSAVLGVLVASLGVFGQAKANCGPGPVVTGMNKGMLQQSLGASTNATFLPTQTLAITSGTSGCSNSGVVIRDAEQRFFVAVNLANISQQMAQGGGSHLDSLAGLLGCPAELYPRFAGFTRRNFAALVPVEGTRPAELLTQLKRGMRSDPRFADSCSRIS